MPPSSVLQAERRTPDVTLVGNVGGTQAILAGGLWIARMPQLRVVSHTGIVGPTQDRTTAISA